MRRLAQWNVAASAGACAAALLFIACGSSPNGPASVPPPPGGGVTPPANNPPVIVSIVVQGTRAKEPSGFADVGEAVRVTAYVRDDETALDQLQFNWSAPLGTFSGTGPSVTWQAPRQGTTPVQVALTLEVVERYGTAPSTLEHRISKTGTLALHDSVKEVGDMARQFLLDFSDSNLRNVDYIMRNFGSAHTCPDVREIDSERSDVINDRTNYQILDSRIGSAHVAVNFGGTCPFREKRGDACAVVPSYWQSLDLKTKAVGAVDGDDNLAAAYSAAGDRWWLCSSDYDGVSVSGAPLRGFRALR
jgi:hypothetical protein